MFSVIGLVLLAAALAVLAGIARIGIGRGPADTSTMESLDLPDTSAARHLIGRWRDRARRWRTAAGLPTAIGVLGLSLVGRGEVHIGIGAGPLWADPLTMGLAAAFVGAIGAELHHLRHRPEGPRTVSLRPRDLGDFLPPGSRRRLGGLAGSAGALAVVHALLPTVSGVPLPAIGALVVAAAVVSVQRSIVFRPRPLLPEDLAAADDVVRGLAVRSVDAAGAGIALLMTLWQVSWMLPSTGPGGGLLAIAAGSVYLAALAVALLWWWRGGPASLLARTRSAEEAPA